MEKLDAVKVLSEPRGNSRQSYRRKLTVVMKHGRPRARRNRGQKRRK